MTGQFSGASSIWTFCPYNPVNHLRLTALPNTMTLEVEIIVPMLETPEISKNIFLLWKLLYTKDPRSRFIELLASRSVKSVVFWFPQAEERQLWGTVIVRVLRFQLCQSWAQSWLLFHPVVFGDVDLQGIRIDCWCVSSCLRSVSQESAGDTSPVMHSSKVSVNEGNKYIWQCKRCFLFKD